NILKATFQGVFSQRFKEGNECAHWILPGLGVFVLALDTTCWIPLLAGRESNRETDERGRGLAGQDYGRIRILPARREPLTLYFLSRYSSGTSSCGTSCVRTSFSSVSPACSTPVTASASNAFPSSVNSATLSESAPSMLDNPCKSPDCPPDLSLSASGTNASVSTLRLFPRTRVLSAVGVLAPVVFWPRVFVFTAAFFKPGFFFANFFFGVSLFLASFFLTVFFSGFPFFPADPFGFVRFLLVLFLTIRAVYHRHMRAHETELDA